MLIQVIAAEVDSIAALSRGTQVKALNYAPGPVNTDMQAEIRTSAAVPEQREFYSNLFETGTLVTPEATTANLVSILEKNEYKNGAHLDFYDK